MAESAVRTKIGEPLSYTTRNSTKVTKKLFTTSFASRHFVPFACFMVRVSFWEVLDRRTYLRHGKSITVPSGSFTVPPIGMALTNSLSVSAKI